MVRDVRANCSDIIATDHGLPLQTNQLRLQSRGYKVLPERQTQFVLITAIEIVRACATMEKAEVDRSKRAGW